MNRHKNERRARLVSLCVVFTPALVAAWYCHPPISASPLIQSEDKLKDPRFIAEGAKLFAPTCGNAYCHGSGGIGGGAPMLRGKSDPAYLFKTISNGIPGTSMLSFKSELSEEQIWKLVAFIMSSSNASQTDASATKKNVSEITPLAVAASESGGRGTTADAVEAGKALFFDSASRKSCHFCHSIRGEGTPIGPDLSAAGGRSARELFFRILLTREIKDPRYSTVGITLRNGERIAGVKKEEDSESIRIYDTTELPAVLRTVQKADIARVETTNQSVMPGDYASTYTIKQLLDLITFLKSSESGTPVTLKDLLQ